MKERIKDYLLFATPQAMVFAVLFVLLRLYEFGTLPGAPHTLRLEAIGFLYDGPVACRLIVAVLFSGMLVAFLNKAAGKFLAVFLFGLLLVGSFLLVQYFSVAQVPLGTDLFGYTVNDIATTIRSSGGMNLLGYAAFLAYVAVFIWGCVKSSRIKSLCTTTVACVVIGAMVLGAFISIKPSTAILERESDHNLVVNKTEYLITRTIKYWGTRTDYMLTHIPPYPFLKKVEYHDVLGEFLNPSDSLPNIVVILVEGLGRDFVGTDANYGGFTPFLDSLAAKSLFWKNGLSNTGRTFGVLPSVLGSLPYGENGFMSMGIRMPDHQTLISLLKAKGYKTSFFYGGNPNFDNQDLFLQYEGVDFFLNENNFPPSYSKTPGNTEGFTWGYADGDVFSYAHEILDKQKAPRLDIYLTLTTHEPFSVPDKEFEKKFEEIVSQPGASEASKAALRHYKNVFSCLLYTDNAIHEFMERSKAKKEFRNTIFLITGDHRLVPAPQSTRISRFQVPLIIYSPLLKQPAVFESLVTHADIAPTLLGYLSARHGLRFPEKMPFISSGLQTSPTFSSSLDLALMRNKGEVSDYIYRDYYLSDERLFQIKPTMDLEPVENDTIKERMKRQLNQFQALSSFALENNQLDKPETKSQLRLFTFTKEEQQFINDEKLPRLTPGELFGKAQSLAFEKDFMHCRIILCFLLNTTPNFHDARLLLARTFGWSEKYDTARSIVKEVMRRSPAYEDAYSALADIEFWDRHPEQSMKTVEDGLRLNPNNLELKVRQARVLWLNGKNSEARAIVENVIKLSPENELASEMFQKMKQ